MKQIKLTQEKFALVDDEDFDYLNQFKWYYNNGGYAVRNSSKKLGKHTIIYMHRIINQTVKGLITDHINGNKLDNRRINLRTCTKSQNTTNSKKIKDSKSKYKGVHWCKRDKKWAAQVRFHGKSKYLGRFKNEIDAARAYDEAAKKLFGDYAKLNFGDLP